MLPSQLPMFLAAASEGSFSAAGRKQGVSAAAVSKAVALLEQQTGVRLFHRNTRQFSLTEDGASLYQKLLPLLSDIESSLDSLTEQNKKPEGKIKVNLPDSFAREFILPLLPEFYQHYPEITLDLVFDDQVLDIVDQGFDVAIGNRINQDSRLVARPIYQLQGGIFASSEYVKNHGLPKSIDQLLQHNCIVYKPLSSGRAVSWPLQDKQGLQQVFQPKGNLHLSNISAAKVALLQHLGLAYMGQWHVTQELKQGKVVPVLKAFWSDPRPVWIYYSSREGLPKRVRVFIDFIVEKFGKK